MKHIIKSHSEELEIWKQTWQLTKEDLLNNPLLNSQKNELWGKLSGEIKNTVKHSLLEEQGYVCCYCQQRIELDKDTIIEHLIARNNAPEKMFDYDNILACCDGGDKDREQQKLQKLPKTPQYCDRKKDDSIISINPLYENCESHFSYEFNPDNLKVSIIGTSEEGNDTIKKLNLDIEELKLARGEAVAGFIFDENGDYISPDEAKLLASKIKQRKANNQFEPFCVVLEQILQNLQSGQNYVS